MNNYEFCTQWVLDQSFQKNTFCILDYGCGAGIIVKELRKRNFHAFGCDVFYSGHDYSESIDREFLDSGIIKRMDRNVIPFDSASFDVVINNQVMEHVSNLDGVLAEIQRVLKPGGKIISLFPDKGAWREGHCGIPFLHRFAKGSRPRVYYAAGLRALGFGTQKGNKSALRWGRDICEWLDMWTHYRTWQEVHVIYRKHFCDIEHIEDYWLQSRLGARGSFIVWLPSWIKKLVVNKFAGMIFVARKPV